MDPLEASVSPSSPTDEAVQTLFRNIDDSGVLPAHVAPFEAADAVLCALEMRLPRTQAEEVAHDVPPTLQLLIRRCVIHKTERPAIQFDERAFLRLVASALRTSLGEAERVARAVFMAVQKLMPEREILDVRRRLPHELDELWYPRGPSRFGGEPPDVPGGMRPVEEPIESILREIELSGVLPKGLSATEALQIALCTLSLELTGHEAHELADTSPTFRRLLGPCVRHRDEPPVVMRGESFLKRLAYHYGFDEKHAERVARSVFAAVRGRLPPDEIHTIDNRIPRSVRPLWKPR